MKRTAFLVIITGLLLVLAATSSTAVSAPGAKPKPKPTACKTGPIPFFKLPVDTAGALTKFVSTPKEVLLLGGTWSSPAQPGAYESLFVGSWNGKQASPVNVPFPGRYTEGPDDLFFHHGQVFIGGNYLVQGGKELFGIGPTKPFTIRRLKSGEWQDTPVPASVAGFQKFLVANGNLWMAARDETGYLLLLRWEEKRWGRPVATPRDVDAWGRNSAPVFWEQPRLADLAILPNGEILIVGLFFTDEKIVSGSEETSKEVMKPLAMTWKPGEAEWRFSPPALGGFAEEHVSLDSLIVSGREVVSFGRYFKYSLMRGYQSQGAFGARRQGSDWILLPPFAVSKPARGIWQVVTSQLVVQQNNGDTWSRVSFPELKKLRGYYFSHAAVVGDAALLVGGTADRSNQWQPFFTRKCL